MEEVDLWVYAGVDWATEEHAVCVVSHDGTVLGERLIPNDATGLSKMCDWLLEFSHGSPERIAVGIEVPHGVVVETLLDRTIPVYSINPKQMDRFRDRFSPSGAKDDARDALVIADSLRTDRHCYRRIAVDLPEVIELREWSRIHEDLNSEGVRLANRIRAQLHRYYPQILTVADKVARPWFLDLWELAPTPAQARRIRRPRLLRFLNEHHIRTVSAEDLWELFRQPTVTVSQGTTDAASAHIRLAIERLRVVNRQQTECQTRLDALCSALVPEPTSEDIPENRCPEHHDVEILRSLPGIGRIVLAMVLGEAWWAIQARDYDALRTLSGIAPVTRASGKSRKVIMRRACNTRLREAMYHWTRIAVQKDAVSRQRYTALRSRGHSHGRALRTVGDRLLGVACAMLRNGTLYDSEHRGLPAVAEAC
ncbi:MAG: IS110 family transposase [Lentisphaerae bacterium]|nr:IS110 family transposase [Lentisphaerota bacterium]